MMKRKSNLELWGRLTNHHITIKGNKLNLRWFDKCLLIWSEEYGREQIPKKALEIVEDALFYYDRKGIRHSKLSGWSSKRKSKTFKGIAKAMAEQWGGLCPSCQKEVGE